MPAYDYVCAACGRRFEVIHGVHADGPTSCPLCGKGPVRKAISAPAVHYKGSGWAKKERRPARTSADAGAKSSDDTSDSGSSSGSDEGAAKEPATAEKPVTAPKKKPADAGATSKPD
jgi:putative FmdB family regulatory protein